MNKKWKEKLYNIKYYFKKHSPIILMLVFLCPILGYSYSTFIFDTSNYRSDEMYIGNLLYSIRIDDVPTNSLTIDAHSEVEAVIQVTSLNEVSSNYKLVYEDVEGISAVYASDDNLPTHGLVTTSQISTVLITNSSNETKTLRFDVAGGYNTNTLEDVILPDGYLFILDSYMKYDYETLALFVDGERVDRLDSDVTYNLVSYNCTNGETVEYDKFNRKLSILPSDEQTKCQLYFEEYPLLTITETMLANNTPISDSSINYSQVANTAAASGLFYTSRLDLNEDINNDGVGELVYYYRGIVENNYLVFANLCWRVVRTNEDGSVRLRYSGIPTVENGEYSCPQTGTNVGINNNELIKYNQTYVDSAYMGYMMGMDNQCVNTSNCVGNIKSTSAETAQTNTYSSNVKLKIDEWFENNIASKGSSVTSKLANVIYCNDRNFYSGAGYNSLNTIYNASQRLNSSTNARPQYKCDKPNDSKYGSLNNTNNNSFTLSAEYGGTTGFGNNKLRYPVALLSADEIVYAGGVYNKLNTAFYLKTLNESWLMTPIKTDDNTLYPASLVLSGTLYFQRIYSGLIVMPTLSLKSDVKVQGGIGQYNDPYIVQ